LTNVQEIAHPEGHDYTVGSPHLKHADLRARIDASLRQEIERIRARDNRCRALEVGAGHGTFTAVLRKAGATVTVTEMSEPSAANLRRSLSNDPGVNVVSDPDGSWVFETDDRFDLVVAISVLHHIPDYLSTVARYADITERGGTFISWQDPAWYPRLSRRTLLAQRSGYLAWRLGQGNFSRGFATRIRRFRGVLDATQVSDMSEYHVVRQGIDEEALESLLGQRYAETMTTMYWSTQADLLQRIGDRLGLGGTFFLVARDRLPDG
jgi:protein-L-isoaspartate O-methyltransferase